MDGGVVAQVRASTVQQEREKTLMQRCNMQLASTVWWNNGRIVKSSKPKPKDKWTYANKKGRQEASNRVVCGSRQVSVSVYETRKKQQ